MPLNPTMNARPNMNGDAPETFQQSGRAINAAAMDAGAILNTHVAEIFNGRNYQHHDDPMGARAADLARVDAIRAALRDMEALAIAIYQAGA